ncbi:methyltransferase [Marinicauda pacifica]|uniref:Class I SAM-dependent methyltransferase n=1 Tax=Marinicauda pacifica TaxID=1133559 RepID=A0A4S2H8I8_9PROT|nr:methyltransferase domain-containing protein [Marinicauda pacifica]TGY92147.1 class I SAM-dependent methyltransferase [Marinicauda pacifica]GGE46369.1 methyltransferase [Marinicauda pacifica]
MRTDALWIERFYRTKRGQAARAMVRRRLGALWPDLTGLDVGGYGYPLPFMDAWREQARRTVVHMPEAQGAVRWPERPDGPSLTVLGGEARLPFAEAVFDRMLLAHALEESADPRKLLRELWRVMAPEGRMVIVCAHRAGIWSRADSTPFGHGRPFSRSQLSELLTGALFEPVAWANALYTPPWGWTCGPRLSESLEAIGEKIFPAFGGLILVEAVKHVGAVRPGQAERVRSKALEGRTAAGLSPARRRPLGRSVPPMQERDAP